MSQVHVQPVGDLIEHEDTDDCACLPTSVPTEGGFVVVHNAWDGRRDPEDTE